MQRFYEYLNGVGRKSFKCKAFTKSNKPSSINKHLVYLYITCIITKRIATNMRAPFFLPKTIACGLSNPNQMRSKYRDQSYDEQACLKDNVYSRRVRAEKCCQFFRVLLTDSFKPVIHFIKVNHRTHT